MCSGKLELQPQAYFCGRCDRIYPVLFGIPDFRLRSDRYLSIEEERTKAERIAMESEQKFSSMLDYYYRITDDVPLELASRYKAYHYNGPAQATHSLDKLMISSEDNLLDVGCGTGGALIAASGKTGEIVGVDIALRWLVICKQRLNEHSVKATLVCADAEALPFPESSFTKILASDLLENVHIVDKTLISLNRQLKPNGSLWISGSNKFCIGPHPTTRIWAIGYFPKWLRSKIVTKLRGIDSLRFINLISPFNIAHRAKQIGLQVMYLSPKIVRVDNSGQYPLIDRLFIKSYTIIASVRLFRRILLLFGPGFEMVLYKLTEDNKHKED